MSTHTPGPWRIDELLGPIVYDSTGQRVADCQPRLRADGRSRPRGEQHANARLIAASPELLAALKAFFDIHHGAGLLDIDVSKLQRAIDEARAVVAKAEGRS